MQELGLNFEETIIRPRFLDIPKSVTDDYPTAIVLNSRDVSERKAFEEQLAAFHRLVTDGLEECGYRRCPGDVMAVNDRPDLRARGRRSPPAAAPAHLRTRPAGGPSGASAATRRRAG